MVSIALASAREGEEEMDGRAGGQVHREEPRAHHEVDQTPKN